MLTTYAHIPILSSSYKHWTAEHLSVQRQVSFGRQLSCVSQPIAAEIGQFSQSWARYEEPAIWERGTDIESHIYKQVTLCLKETFVSWDTQRPPSCAEKFQKSNRPTMGSTGRSRSRSRSRSRDKARRRDRDREERDRRDRSRSREKPRRLQRFCCKTILSRDC